MKLQGPNLSLNMKGEDVELLQRKLEKLEGIARIPDEELSPGRFGEGTREAVLDFQKKYEVEPTGVVDEQTANLLNGFFVVQGHVRNENGEPLVGVTCKAADKDLRSEQHLAQAKTDKQGSYKVKYKPGKFRRAETGKEQEKRADLIVRVYDKEGKELTERFKITDQSLEDLRSEQVPNDVLAKLEVIKDQEFVGQEKFVDVLKREIGGEQTSEYKPLILKNTKVPPSPIFNAKPVETVNFFLGEGEYKGPSEYDRHIDELRPLLRDVEVPGIQQPKMVDRLYALREDNQYQDISFLAGETGISRQHMEFLVTAAQHEKETAAKLEEKTKVPAEAFYGFFRQNLPTGLPALLAQDQVVLRNALETSCRDNVIPVKICDSIDAILARVQDLHVEQTFTEPEIPGKYSLGALLDTSARLSSEMQRTFVRFQVGYEGRVEDFWDDLGEAHPEFKEEGVTEDTQFTLQLGALTQNHLPLVKELRTQIEEAKPESLRALASLDADGWLALINKEVDGEVIGTPPDVPGDESEKARNFATTLARLVEGAFGTAVLFNRLEQDEQYDIPGKDDLLRFFRNTNPHFDLGKTNIKKLVADHGDTVMAGVQDTEGTTKLAESFQRLYRISPSYERDAVVFPLLANGIDSALSIARRGSDAFVRAYAAIIGDARAEEVHARARHISAMALTLFTKYGEQFHSTASTPRFIQDVEGIPNWKTLFGSPTFCECEHCRSVLSPAAYLVDVLEFLKDPQFIEEIQDDGTVVYDNDKSALDALLERRPDTGEIELSCENTNTPLPYVDLVSEVFENAVAPIAFSIEGMFQGELDDDSESEPSADLRDEFERNRVTLSLDAVISVETPGSRWAITDGGWRYVIELTTGTGELDVSAVPQTRGTAEELAANPEHVNPRAYDTLAQAVYPWTLPFDLWSEEARVYLDHLGVPRYQLMEAFHTEPPPSELTDVHIATEYLGLTRLERRIISARPLAPTREPWEFWGLEVTGNEIHNPEDPETPLVLGWMEALSWVRVFLEKSGLSFKELLELEKMDFVTFSVEVDPTCDLEHAVIRGLDETGLDRIHRFIRLQRKLGWTIRELDKTITVLDPGHLDRPRVFVRLAAFKRLRARSKMPLIEMLSWWGRIDTAQDSETEKSLYDRIFLNRTVLNPEDDVFNLNADRDDLVGPPFHSINDHVTGVLAGLGIRDADLQELMGELPNDRLNMANLSLLYRHVTLARALKLSIPDFLLVKSLTGINPFATRRPEETLRFADMVQKIRASGFKMAELNYLLRHVDQTPAAIAPAEDYVALILSEIRDGLQKIFAETSVTADLTAEFVREKLAIMLESEEQVEEAVTIIEDGSARSTDIASEQNDSIDASFGDFVDTTEAKTKLVGSPPAAPDLTDTEERFTYVLEQFRNTLSRNIVIQKLADTFDLDVAVAEQLLTKQVKSPNDSTRTSMVDFLEPDFVESEGEITEANFESGADLESLFKTFILLHKVAMVVSKLGIKLEELPWVFEETAAHGWLNLNTLPADDAAPTASFDDLEWLIDLIQLRDAFPRGEPTLFEILNPVLTLDTAAADPAAVAAAEETFLQALRARTGWSEADLAFLVGPGGFNFSFPDDYRAPDKRALMRVKACFGVIKRLGVSAAQARPWTNTRAPAHIAQSIARSIKQAVKAKYDDARWLKVAGPLKDELREKQRSALVAYLVALHGLRDSSGLYDYFLIDPEMDPCMMTSRIKQANSTVQLFVQRCAMGLESQVHLSRQDAQRWKWMKNYRVWEANRKVFLYPENWIEPELRDDKSPFFKDLENELLQNEITADTAETAFLHYLEKLDEVARLEIAGMYHQLEKDSEDRVVITDILHVFGRTRNTPHVYYYRRWVDSSYWTPWERVDVDIEGDHLIPVVWNRRLYLFWPIFTEKADENQPLPAFGARGERPRKYWEIQLAWSQNKNGKWAAKRTSRDVAITKHVEFSAQPKVHYFFKTFILKESSPFTNDLVINGYLRNNTVIRDIDWQDYFGVLGFRISGCDESVDAIPTTYDVRFRVFVVDELFVRPPHTDIQFMRFVENAGSEHKLWLRSGRVDGSGHFITPGSPDHVLTLREIPVTFKIAYPHQFNQFVSQAPFFYEDHTRTFFVVPRDTYMSFTGSVRPSPRGGDPFGEVTPIGDDRTMERSRLPIKEYQFQSFYHPYVCTFIEQLNRYGIDGLLSPGNEMPDLSRQQLGDDFFMDAYSPTSMAVRLPHPKDDVDYSPGGGYSIYNWELFFHAPLLIADRLSKNQRFEEALRWFQYIFDPTDRSEEPTPQRFWKVRSLFEQSIEGTRIEDVMRLLSEGDADLENQVVRWRDNPFNPHLIARMRTIAYQKTVVMKFIDNLIAWGDQLFRRSTIESINEATQLYILAAQILGPRPESVPVRDEVRIRTYRELEPVDAFSNALVQIENLVTVTTPPAGREIDSPPPPVLYFCIPKNDKLLSYWDTVADRLFKIRHCMTIEGVVRQLPLFEPPIDPSLLVRAAAAGVDISSAINDLNAALPHYRFQVILQKAVEFCNDVKALGTALVSALEKRDAEALALLRSGHELQLLDNVRLIKKQQINEAEETHEGLKESRRVAEIRRNYYRDIVYINPNEQLHMDSLGVAHIFNQIAQGVQAGVAGAHAVPNFDVGTAGWASPVVKASFGGNNLGSALEAAAGLINMIAAQYSHDATMASIKGGYDRRWDDWRLQEELADKELDQIDKQIAAAEIRLAIAEQDLNNHDRQIENTKEVDTFMRDKFTNHELYNWMVSQISTIYFQSYQMTYDLCKRAERAFQHEIADPNATFINFGYWDSLKKGLLAGERMYYDLKRMEMAYFDQNKREYELTKHVSLAMLDPVALVKLKETGECFVSPTGSHL